MKNLYILFFVVFATFTAQAQVDRSVMPKPGPAPEINLKEPQSFHLNNGLKVLVVENHKLPRVSIQLTIDNPPILEGKKAGVSSLTGALLGKGTKNIDKDEFNEEIDFLGARMSFGPQSAYASSLSKYFPRIMELLADAAINPNFSQEEFEKEKEKLITGLKTEEKDVPAIAGRVQRALAYGKNHPYGEFTTIETVNNVGLSDVEAFYRDYFVPANAYLVVIGDVDVDTVKELTEKYFTSWTKAVPPTFTYSTPQNVYNTQINFVDMPNAVQSEIAVQNIVTLKMKDEDYLPTLIANQILGGGGEGRLFLNLREDKAYTYGSYSSIGNDKYEASRFVATASVRNAVTDSSVVEILNEIDRIIAQPVSEKELKNTKAKYAGRFVMALEQPQTIANYALNIEKEGLPKDFYKTYLERLEKITIEDVQNAAKKYFSSSNARVVVVGKGSEVLENLENIQFKGKTLPVHYYTKTADKTEKPNYKSEIPAGVTAKSIIEKYIEAIGGKTKLKSIESFAMDASAEMQGMQLELQLKKTAKNQLMQDIKMMGNSMTKQVLNNDKGYVVMQGQRKDLSEEEIQKIKEEAALFPELNFLSSDNISLEGSEMVGDKKAYKIKATDSKTIFYDADTGLKLKEVNVAEMQGQQMQQTLIFDDYKEVSGVLFPFKLSQSMGPQNIDFTVTEIKINSGVSAADFE
ncbi:insulinase family protein [Maribacter sp. MMG018]|uniref:M16 family metallopeptidase n=1 Tax=Maribacter sp. MMG018 TaxID=2822688 RepID=UPI001B35DEB1|nr:pitrilysin family protein [Maribacter sp. MMG018]MBQ4913093.1 insulinase family protein [Maribacter sp. MMG018]